LTANIAAARKLGGFLGVFIFPYLMNWKGLKGAESAAAIASVAGLIVTATMLPETKGKSLEEIENEDIAPAEKRAKAA
jgi:PHS family inorganic phosphate transporter-like MFS transporter